MDIFIPLDDCNINLGIKDAWTKVSGEESQLTEDECPVTYGVNNNVDLLFVDCNNIADFNDDLKEEIKELKFAKDDLEELFIGEGKLVEMKDEVFPGEIISDKGAQSIDHNDVFMTDKFNPIGFDDLEVNLPALKFKNIFDGIINERRKKLVKYNCLYCSYRAGQISKLHAHIATEHKNLRFTCSECGKKFETPKILNKHKTQHIVKKKLKLYKCGKCSFKINKRKYLKEHIKINH